MEDLLNGYFLQVLTFVCINIILAMTIYMTLCTGILSLGNAGLMSFGAYTSAILTAQYHVPMPVGIFLGGVMAVLVALVIGLPTIRLRGLYLAIATLGFGEVVRVIALNLEITHGALGYSGDSIHGKCTFRLCKRLGAPGCFGNRFTDGRTASCVSGAAGFDGSDYFLLVPAGTFPHRPRHGSCEGR